MTQMDRHLTIVRRAYKYLVNYAEGMNTDDEELFTLIDDLETIPGVWREEDNNGETASLYTQ